MYQESPGLGVGGRGYTQQSLAVVVEAGAERVCLCRWRLGCVHRWEEGRVEIDPSLNVSRWRVNTPSLTYSITKGGDWRCVWSVVCGLDRFVLKTHAYN